jgi:hypothetical protein
MWFAKLYKTLHWLMVTLKNLHSKLITDGFSRSKTSYFWSYENISVGKIEDSITILIKRQGVRYQRLCFITRITKCREERRPVTWADKACICSSHTPPYSWYYRTGSGTCAPVSKRNRLIIVHSSSESGSVPHALLIFRSSAWTGAYHG